MKWLLAACLACLMSPAEAEPAIWLAQSATARVYLFGTMHILPKHIAWFGPKAEAALRDSAILYEEADIGSFNAAAYGRIMNQAVSPDTDLFTLLPSREAEKFREQIRSCHLPVNIVAHYKPWFASMLPTLCSVIGQRHGDMQGEPGPEATLIGKARVAGKQIAFFETAEQQIGYLTASPEKAQIASLEQSINEGNVGDELNGMEGAWASGDVSAISTIVTKSRVGQEDFYQTIFVQRNARFAARIAQLLHGRASVFVAIGAGHLAGPDSVQAQLARQGIVAKRL